MGEVSIERAGTAGRVAISNMMQLYMHDFADFWPSAADDGLGEDGRFGDYPSLESFWTTPGRLPLIIRRSGGLIGFALINRRTHSGLAADWNMAEFFIARGCRRSGAGTAAARLIFAALAGRWEVAVLRVNAGAMFFWPRAIAACVGAGPVERLDPGGAGWDGPVFRFVSPGGGAPLR
jgi:predicted acetyltransferase